MKVTVGLTVGRLSITKDLGTSRGSGGRSVRMIRVRCSECGESRRIISSNFGRMAQRKCQRAQTNEARANEQRRLAERERQVVQVERRKRERLAAHRVPLETQREIKRLGSLREPLAPGFTVRVWRINDLARKFGVPRITVERILNGEYEQQEGST